MYSAKEENIYTFLIKLYRVTASKQLALLPFRRVRPSACAGLRNTIETRSDPPERHTRGFDAGFAAQVSADSGWTLTVITARRTASSLSAMARIWSKYDSLEGRQPQRAEFGHWSREGVGPAGPPAPQPHQSAAVSPHRLPRRLRYPLTTTGSHAYPHPHTIFYTASHSLYLGLRCRITPVRNFGIIIFIYLI
ncbi:hypothetical protein EVAR_23270_1 [Eumeta japonica]|uniref:Uncharacterized protein n=1 Tax=Eumeta variegata TaxID=151549 RepID=A0A4C1V7B9_EUMVA|nr:hypothetical protein EVAR_23270_1 [Eumeta japonica]